MATFRVLRGWQPCKGSATLPEAECKVSRMVGGREKVAECGMGGGLSCWAGL